MLYEKETQMKAVEFITINVTCIAATNQGQLLLKVQNLTKYVHMVATNNKIPKHLNTYVHNQVMHIHHTHTKCYGLESNH